MPLGLFQMKRKAHMKISFLVVAFNHRLNTNHRLDPVKRRQENSRHRRTYDIPPVCVVSSMSARFKADEIALLLKKGYFNHTD